MARLIDTSLWVDLGRSKTPRAVREQARCEVEAADSCFCEPVIFELRRGARATERGRLEHEFTMFPCVPSPQDLWWKAALLGQRYLDAGLAGGSLDLLIATVALLHDAEVVAFDGDFLLIAKAEPRLRVRMLTRATSVAP